MLVLNRFQIALLIERRFVLLWLTIDVITFLLLMQIELRLNLNLMSRFNLKELIVMLIFE